ncbi:hypothetical protein KFK14_11265 [Sphingobium phenoxybenzoativorans]|uniref:Tip attachment protein J domain-containing protein n=1 Tax=Sphingobium phenoxybenzoativorans TaxID=1592790 RepID=A0A975KC11_9SPHN|nr:hypothetical protein [Sphingobium phenoxybenzoativorans]QUT07908.1 hypothetical protein KFK14_11265 [Sphingobium phenoxybenzoativorans]
MSKTLGKVAMIAGAVALVATGVGAVAGAGTVIGGIGTASSIASYASIAATAASIGAQVTAKKPPARGTVNQVLIASDAPSPYVIGRTFYAGVLRHDWGYGATLKKVKNPYRGMVLVYSVAGPIEGMESVLFDYQAVPFAGGSATGYYSGYLYEDHRLGNTPDTALTPHFAGFSHWDSDYRLSGKACGLFNLLFDKKGKRFSGGVPVNGRVLLGVKVYDPRKDSTYPGGSGAHRISDESTWEYSENPGLHGLTYSLGRYRVGKKVFGIGLPADGIDIASFVAFANVCDANSWKVGGVIFEPGSKGANLKDILQAGAAEWTFIGAKLGVKYNAPRVAIDVITPADLADDDAEIPAMQIWPDRKNGLIPKFRSENHKWEYVAGDLVSVAEYVAEDGEPKEEERQLNLVQDKNQAAQIVAYELVNGRELSGINLVCKPRLRRYGPGDMLTLQLPEHGLVDIDAVVTERSVDPARMTVTLSFMSETPGKHAYALGQVGTAPPTPSLLSPEEKDGVASSVAGNDPEPATNLVVTGGSGSATVSWRNPTNSDFEYSKIYRGTTNVFGSATVIAGPLAGALGQVQQINDATSPGTKYYWIESYTDEDIPADPTGPVSGVIT